jgi:hypothetical protein
MARSNSIVCSVQREDRQGTAEGMEVLFWGARRANVLHLTECISQTPFPIFLTYLIHVETAQAKIIYVLPNFKMRVIVSLFLEFSPFI